MNILAFSTLGSNSYDERRLVALLAPLAPKLLPFDRSRKCAMFWQVIREIYRAKPQLTVMEGTGLAGGLALILCRLFLGRSYVVSSGDAVGPWVSNRRPLLGPVFGAYERILCRLADGFIGWSPYLTGRALTFGARRAMTAAGWAPFLRTKEDPALDRIRTRLKLGIPDDHLVIGIAGSLSWSRRHMYCYGRELIEAALQVKRTDITFLIVGEGDGRTKLESLIRNSSIRSVIFAGQVPQAELPGYYAAMDVASLPQSVDGVGSFRYSTKLSEYLHFQLPVIIGQIPLAYDLDDGWIWRLPGDAPWDARYIRAMVQLLSTLNAKDIASKRNAIPEQPMLFDRMAQVTRVERFIKDILSRDAI